MEDIMIPGIVGLLICIMGIGNMKGNISTLHWYHRQRVSEADRKPFGKLVGAGTLLMGMAIILYAGLSYVSYVTQNQVYSLVGAVVLVASLIVGLGVSFYAMMKYNKGIF